MTVPAQLVVIPGFEKCWTTSLANFLITNRMCSSLVPKMKEPFIFSRHEFNGLSILPGVPVLDASQSYINNPNALDNLVPYNPKLILVYRNPYDRAFSAFRMYKLYMSMTTEKLNTLKRAAESNQFRFPKLDNARGMRDLYHFLLKDIVGITYYEKTKHYIDIEIDRILSMSFVERLDFEREFFESKGYFPYFSILVNSLFFRSTKFVTERFSAQNILPVSVHVDIDHYQLAIELGNFIGTTHKAQLNPLTRDFDISNQFEFYDASYKDSSNRTRYQTYFNNDVIQVNQLLSSHGCNMTMFDPQYMLSV